MSTKPIKKAIAKIMVDGELITVEGGLKDWDNDYLYFLLPEGGEAMYPKDDVEDLQRFEELFVLKKTTVKVPTNTNTTTSEKKPTTQGPKTLKPGSALEQVVNICRANPTLTRKQIIAKIIEAMPGKTEGFASTYHNLAMKHINGQ